VNRLALKRPGRLPPRDAEARGKDEANWKITGRRTRNVGRRNEVEVSAIAV